MQNGKLVGTRFCFGVLNEIPERGARRKSVKNVVKKGIRRGRRPGWGHRGLLKGPLDVSEAVLQFPAVAPPGR